MEQMKKAEPKFGWKVAWKDRQKPVIRYSKSGQIMKKRSLKPEW